MEGIEKLGITPGPWYSRSRNQNVYGPAGVSVAWFGENGIYGKESYSISKKEACANARVAAAAPEMLEALIDLYDDWKYIDHTDPDIAIRPIIEKATGRKWNKIKESI
jgi:hypothetical protein